MTNYEELKWRGLVKDEAGDVESLINKGGFSFYWGTDPTADSLHIGHYSSLVTAKRLAKMGNHPVLLVGGATGLIGDPRPTAEREIISIDTVMNNVESIKNQVINIFDGNCEVVNNYDWMKDMDLITFLRDTGKYINVNYMLDKDIIRRRLETGITFAEFSYTLMQGYDFLHLFKEKNVVLQAEGSDQWGNITTGIDLIRKVEGKEAYGITMPLILDANGNKFGKSEGNALWLDKNKTSPYELYQYLINSSDTKVEEYLKVFTFLTKEEIIDIMKRHNECPEKRIAQEMLAHEFIRDLHGEEDYQEALKISKSLFSGDIKNLNVKEIEMAFKGIPSYEISEDTSLVDLLVDANVVSSKREAREFITNNAISINGDKINDLEFVVNRNVAIDDKYIIIRRGKKKYHVVKFN